MAKKRFTDIEIWDREWYMELKPVHKCLMKYIFDKCDACGCWKPNWKLASLHIGEDVNFNDLMKLPKDQYEVLESGKIFIPDFIKFQYGQLSAKSPAHNPVFLAIEKNNLSDRVFNRVYNTPKEKEKEKEKEIKEGVEGEKKRNPKNFPIASDFNGLPSGQFHIAILGVKNSGGITITDSKVTDLWENFKGESLTGKVFYADEEAVYTHFQRWIKKQKIHNEPGNISQKSKLGNKSGGFSILTDALKKNE